VPSHVTSDNVTEFEAELGHLLAHLNVEDIKAPACVPAVVERLAAFFKSMLDCHVNSHSVHWVQSVPSVLQQYMARIRQAQGVLPQDIVFDRRPFTVLPLARDVLTVAAASSGWVVPEDCSCVFVQPAHPPTHSVGCDLCRCCRKVWGALPGLLALLMVVITAVLHLRVLSRWSCFGH
jgi:hypothetical protein